MAVTSKDIARQLKISQSTVSRALRGDPRVAPETTARILETARQMDYTPNLAARSLITRKTGTVALIVSDITNPFYPELLDVLHNEFALGGYRTVLFNERTDAPLEQHVSDLVNGAAVDGLVYVSATLGTPLPGRGVRAVPVVLVNRYIDSTEVDTVVSDNRRGGRIVAQAIVGLGHRRIALIAGPENATTSRDRERGFREGLEARRVEFDETLRRAGQFSHTAATSAASTCSRRSRGRPRSSQPTTSSPSARSTPLVVSESASRTSSRSWASTTSTWRGGRGST